jgi:predicted XRE-type DNA-binding protein
MTEKITPIDFVESSGNVFADLGLEDAEELLMRAKLGSTVRKILENRNLKESEIALILNIKESDVSNLMKGKYYLFSEGQLFNFLNNLDQKIIVKITQHQSGEPWQDVALEIA